MMGYSELHAAADRLIIPEDVRSCLGRSDTRLSEHDLHQVDEYLYHAVVVGLVFADRVARRIVNKKITLPGSKLRPMCYYVAKEVSESDWVSELRGLAKSGEMLNFVESELKAMTVVTAVRWHSHILSKITSLLVKEHGYTSISILVEEILKFVFSSKNDIVCDRITKAVNDAVVDVWSCEGWLKKQDTIADNIRGVLNCSENRVTNALQLSTKLMGLGYIFKLDDELTREFLVEAIAEGVWKRVNKNSSESNDGDR